ncbi:HNH endonuclease [Sphingobium olei]|uniref:HNH endonuclease n=2 Tax=Sphingobium olei TaxID=420955 RepID=A0ABW3NTV2_9SPHN|nr:HNH endonuclease [Sphingobium sp.]
MCLAQGRTELATRVDHIDPLALGGSDEDDNTRNLCEPHHKQVTAEQFGHATTPHQRGCDAAGRPIDPTHPWARCRAGRGG